MTATTLSPERRRRVEQAIVECNRYIAKEERRAADLRPAAVVEMLAGYYAHRDKLRAMLAADEAR